MYIPLLDKLKSSQRNSKENESPRTRHIRPLSFRANRFSKRFDREPKQPVVVVVPDPELDQLENEVQELRKTEKVLNETYRGLEEEIEVMGQKLGKREGQHEELERITKELAIAQRFLSTADSLSQAEVVRAMESLNEEIFQLTSILAEKVQVAQRQLQNSERLEMFRTRVVNFGPLESFLEVVENQHLDDVTAIQIGWQAILVYWCSEFTQGWVVVGSDSGELNKMFAEIYKGIISEYEQAVAGCWRSMAYGVLQDVSQDTRKNLPVDLIRALVALPVICGYISSQKQHNDLCKEFEQRIEPLVNQCLKFRKLVGEGITSTNIRPYFCASGEVYDSRYAELEYEDEEDGKLDDKQGIISCPLGLGLCCVQHSRNEEGENVESKEPILKSKVILQKTLQEIIT